MSDYAEFQLGRLEPTGIAPYYTDDQVTLFHGDCLEVLPTLPDASVDAVVTDPPYGLEFMGKEWDTFPVRQRGQGGTGSSFYCIAIEREADYLPLIVARLSKPIERTLL